MAKNNESSSNFPMGRTAQERGFPYVPECYKVQPSDRGGLDSKPVDVPLIDFEGMSSNPERRSEIINKIGEACRHNGFFQVINHGIEEPKMEGALAAASGFLDMPMAGKAKYMSSDVHKAVRYGTSVKDGVDKVQYWRTFLKHYAHPLKDWVDMWPDTPHYYREKMGEYVVEVQKLAVIIMVLIVESLGLSPTHLDTKLDDGMQVMAVNSYPACPQPELTLGLPPHTDYCCLTIILQESPGLRILDPEDKSWSLVPVIKGALQVNVGDQLEVLSNGKYKSAVHKVTVNSEKTRFSVASLHSMGMNVKMRPAEELVDAEETRARYKESSFKDFLNFISKNDLGEGKMSFLDTLQTETGH